MLTISELIEATRGRLINGSMNLAVQGFSIDSRTIRPDEVFVAIKGENFDGHNFIAEAIKKQAKAIIVQSLSPRITKSVSRVACIEVKDTIAALGDIARFRREKFDIPVIALTGTNGKTTTKEMIAWVLSKEFKVLKNAGTQNNQIGLPLTLLNLDSSYKLAVLEIGTNHFGEVEYLARIARPNIAVIANIGPGHLEYLKDLKGVFREKSAIIKHLENPRIAILNADDDYLNNLVFKRNTSPFIFSFGIKNKKEFYATDIKTQKVRIDFLVNQKYRFTLKTLGYYNIYNALVAIAVARIFGMEYKDIAYRLSAFKFLPDRLSLKLLNNVRFINDTYNSNPLSLRQALDTLNNFPVKGRKIFVMGDMLELGSNSKAFHCQAGELATSVCDVFITVGRLSKFAAAEARACGFATKNIFTCNSNSEVKDVLFKKISLGPDDIVLVKGSRAMKMEEILKT